MRPEERLFKAIGAADDALLARCEETPKKRKSVWLPWAMAAAACLAVGVFFAMSRFGAPPVVTDPVDPPPGPVDVLPQPGNSEDKTTHPGPVPIPQPDDSEDHNMIQVPTGPEDPDQEDVVHIPIEPSDMGRFHAVQLTAAVEKPEDEVPEFYIFVDEEGYTACHENGAYVIRPRLQPDPALGLPDCGLRITHRADTTPEEVRAELLAELEAEFETVITEYEDQLYGEGRGGGAAPVRKVRLQEDGQGGVFIFTADYFLEATEGHGIRFDGMINTFRVVDETTPQWLTDLQDTAELLTRGILSDRLDLVADLMTEDAEMETYGEDVLGHGSVSGFDFTTDDPAAPTSAAVTVRIDQIEYPPEFITMELRYEGGKWLAFRAGIEK